MDRFDIDTNISKAIITATELGFIDAADAFAAGATFGGDYRLIADWISGILYACGQCSNPIERKEVQAHIDNFYKNNGDM